MSQSTAQVADLSPTAATIQEIDLTALVASRILHDIATPFGALWNGVEFTRGDSDAESKAHAGRIIEESAQRLRARIEFLRIAFGARGGRQEMVGLVEPRDKLRAYVEGGRVQLDWEPGNEMIPRPASRLLLVLSLLGVEAMPLGGVLRVGVVSKEGPDGETLNLIALADGRKPRIDPMVASLLRTGRSEDPDEPMIAKHAPALFAYRLARDLGADLSFGEEDGRVIFAAAL